MPAQAIKKGFIRVKVCSTVTAGHAHYGYVNHPTLVSPPITVVSQSWREPTTFYNFFLLIPGGGGRVGVGVGLLPLEKQSTQVKSNSPEALNRFPTGCISNTTQPWSIAPNSPKATIPWTPHNPGRILTSTPACPQLLA